MTDLRQAAQAVLDAWDNPTGIRRLFVAMDALDAALEQQAEPVACVACEGRPKGDNIPCAICGATPPQRKWVGLTDEDVNRESAPITSQMKLAFHAGMYVAQQILKEKNGLHKD